MSEKTRSDYTYSCPTCAARVSPGEFCSNCPPTAWCIGCGTPNEVCRMMETEIKDICCGLCIHEVGSEDNRNPLEQLEAADFEPVFAVIGVIRSLAQGGKVEDQDWAEVEESARDLRTRDNHGTTN